MDKMTKKQIAKLESTPGFSWEYTEQEMSWLDPNVNQCCDECRRAIRLFTRKIAYWYQKANEK